MTAGPLDIVRMASCYFMERLTLVLPETYFSLAQVVHLLPAVVIASVQPEITKSLFSQNGYN